MGKIGNLSAEFSLLGHFGPGIYSELFLYARTTLGRWSQDSTQPLLVLELIFVGKEKWLRVQGTGSLAGLSGLRRLFLQNAHLGILLQKLLLFCPALSYWVHRNMLGELYRDRTSELGVSLEIMESNPCRSRAQSSIQVGAASVSLIS